MPGARGVHARLCSRAWRGWLLVLCCAAACGDPERQIVLGPMPRRPPVYGVDDGGMEIPEGTVPCDDAEDCDDGVDCTEDVCLVEGYCRSTGSAARCSDGMFCNGLELCDPARGCVPVSAPGCDDQDVCTIDRCDEAQKACVHDARDFDRDGEIDAHCPGGTDCDDFDETQGRRGAEICGDAKDNDCDDEVDERSCGRGEHDVCADALDVRAGGTFMVQFTGAASDYATSCDERAARDAVFTFELDAPADVTLVARGELPGGSEELAMLALQSECGVLASELQCRRGFPSDLRARALPKGRYYVVASSFGATTLSLLVDFSRPTKPAVNVTCASAADVGDGGRFVGSFVGVGDVESATCGVEGQPDLFYEVTLAEERDLELSVIGEVPSPITLSVQRGCQRDAAELRCESSAPAHGRLHQLPKGRYVIRVEGPSTREIGFALDVAVLPPTPPPAGADCGDPLELAPGDELRLPLADKHDAVTTSCERPGADAVLALRVRRAMDLLVTLDAEDAFATVALQAECGKPATDLFCRGGAPIEARIRDVPAGDYFVVVGARAPSASLALKSLPRSRPTLAADNETCRKAVEIPATGGLFAGDTTGLRDDYQALCGGNARSGDAVFRLVLDDASHVLATLDSGFDSVLYRIADDRTGKVACKDMQAIACNDDGGKGAQGELDEDLQAGTHYLVVDGFKTGNEGPFLLDVTVTPL